MDIEALNPAFSKREPFIFRFRIGNPNYGRNFSAVAGPLLAIPAALADRLWPAYSDYIDEGHVLHQAIKVLQEQTYDVGLYEYPSLPAYLIAGTATACTPVYRLVYGRSLNEEFPSPAEFHTERGDVYDLISPPAFIVLARALVATLSLGTVLLTCLLAQQVTHRSAAAFAMLLIAVCPAVVSRSSTVIVGTIATFFTMLTLYFCARLLRQDAERRRCAWRDTVLAGAGAGLAFVSKYPAGAVSVAVFLTFLLRDEIPLEKA